jgi:hypothetical protein
MTEPEQTTPDNPATSSDTANNPLREQIARVIELADEHSCQMQDGVDYRALTDAVLAVRDRDLRVLADEVTRLSAITGQLRALAEEHPGAIPTNLIDAALDQTAPSPAAPDELAGAYTPDPPIGCLHITAAHDSGPTVAECADADRAWPLQREGE